MQDHHLLKAALALPQESASYSKTSHLLHGYLGGLAGLFMDGALHPIDTVRTRIKTNIHECVNLLTQFRNMRQEGLFSYFRGFTCTLAGSFVANGSYFFMYEKLKHTLTNCNALPQDVAPFAAAFAGGLFSNSIYLPFITVRTRMQLNTPHYDYRHFFDGMKKVLKNEGFRKLYLGGPVFFVQTAIETSLTFGFYEMLYKSIKSLTSSNSDTNIAISMLSSVGAASLAAVVANPLDVLVARMQTMHVNMHGSCGIPEMIKRIYVNEGFKGFMKGVSGTISQYSMAALILFPTYETLKDLYSIDSDY